MIDSFDKEIFMSQPVDITCEQEVIDYEMLSGLPRSILREQTIIIHIGDADYDLRDLIWRLISAEANVDKLVDRVNALERRLDQNEDEVVTQFDLSNIRAMTDHLEYATHDIKKTYGC